MQHTMICQLSYERLGNIEQAHKVIQSSMDIFIPVI